MINLTTYWTKNDGIDNDNYATTKMDHLPHLGANNDRATDPDKHYVCLHIFIRLCYIILFIFAKDIHHSTPSRQKCEKINHEQCNL